MKMTPWAIMLANAQFTSSIFSRINYSEVGEFYIMNYANTRMDNAFYAFHEGWMPNNSSHMRIVIHDFSFFQVRRKLITKMTPSGA